MRSHPLASVVVGSSSIYVGTVPKTKMGSEAMIEFFGSQFRVVDGGSTQTYFVAAFVCTDFALLRVPAKMLSPFRGVSYLDRPLFSSSPICQRNDMNGFLLHLCYERQPGLR